MCFCVLLLTVPRPRVAPGLASDNFVSSAAKAKMDGENSPSPKYQPRKVGFSEDRGLYGQNNGVTIPAYYSINFTS